MKKLAILTAALLLNSVSLAVAQDVAKHPGEGDIQRYGAQWRYQHRYWGQGHENPSECWDWDAIEGKWEWECE